MNNRLIKSNDAGGGACTNTVDLYNPFPDGGGVALYQLNGDATDVSGNYDGTASNVTYGTGQFGQAAVFNGSSSIIKNTQLGVDFRGQTNLTISVWVKTSGHSSSTQINNIVSFSNTNDPSTELHIWFRGSSGNVIKIENRDDGVNSIAATGTDNIADNTWHHIVFTADNNGTKLYLDGIEKTLNFAIGNSSTQISMPNDLNQFNIGANQDSGGVQWQADAEIDQVRIFSRALRPYEVEALYTEEYCTPTIVPSEHFNTVLYTGTNTTNPIMGVGFQPDLIWVKRRNIDANHYIVDTVRGNGTSTYKNLSSNTTDAEATTTTKGITNSTIVDGGFTMQGTGARTNASGDDYVAWCWKAGGAAVTNTDGTITSQVSANTEAGFSIVSFAGGNSSGTTVGHGLGKQLDMLIVKNRSDGTDSWITWHKDVERNSTSTDTFTLKGGNVLALNLTNSTISYNYDGQMGSIGGENLIAYCFAEVEGFSNFGSYVGNGSTSGPTVITGFEPAFVMIKSSSLTGSWRIWDNKRSPENPRNEILKPNESEAEETNSPNAVIDFLENGFQPKSTHSSVNTSGAKYIYMAFAADPTAVEPTLEDSFNTVVYSGDGTSNNEITGVGFQPDLVWIKQRNNTASHSLQDSVRGAGQNFNLYSDNTAYEGQYGIYGYLSSFDINGFTVNAASGSHTNASGTDNYVAWCWKGAEIPAINSNGSIPSVVSANPAAGFSIVSYTTQSSGTATVGHGLNTEPNIVLVKTRGVADSWRMYHSSLGAGSQIYLNLTNAAGSTANQWNNTAPTSSVFSLGTDNAGSYTTIAYCFAEVAGFSKFGSYVGNGLPLGPTIDCGFEPAFIMVKRTSNTADWIMLDNKRNVTNPKDKYLFANTGAAEGISTRANFLSNGFEVITTGANMNFLGDNYIYMAFANQF